MVSIYGCPTSKFTVLKFPCRRRAGYFILLYCALLIGSRVQQQGSYRWYELLWGCNMSMVMSGIGLLTGRPLLVGAAVGSMHDC